MRLIQILRDDLTDESLRFAILVGLATVPFTLFLSWEPVANDVVIVGSSISGTPLLIAGLVVGYRYSARATSSRRAGIWTGLAGSIAFVLLSTYNTVTTVGSASPAVTALAAVGFPFGIALGVGLTVLVTALCAQFANWVRTRLDRDHRTRDATEAADQASADSRWWRRAIVVYALVAPVVIGYALLVDPADGAGFLLAAISMIALVPLSIVALVALFVDATAPRGAKADRIPNVWTYAGTPLGVYAVVYATAALRGSENPAGDGVYGFMAALWIASVAYLVFGSRSVRAPSSTR